MKIRIGVDLDTTLNNLEEVWLKKYNRDYNDNLTPNDMINWDPTKYVKPECGDKIFEYLKEPGLFSSLDIKQNARDVMEFLHNNFDVYIVSSCHPNVVADKWIWIENHLPFIPVKNFIPLDEKNLLKLDYLVDDGPHNIEQFDGIGLIFDAPYNRYLKDRYLRFREWLNIKYYFKEVLSERNTKLFIPPNYNPYLPRRYN